MYPRPDLKGSFGTPPPKWIIEVSLVVEEALDSLLLSRIVLEAIQHLIFDVCKFANTRLKHFYFDKEHQFTVRGNTKYISSVI